MRHVRARNERVQRGDLAGAVGDAQTRGAAIEQAASRVDHARAAIAAATSVRDRALGEGTAMATLAHLDRYVRRLRRELEAAQREVSRAEALHRGQLALVDEARGRLGVARAERELIERHFAAWRAERRKLAERRAD
jgi:hypothetical protein